MKKTIEIKGFIYAKMPESWCFENPEVVDGVKYQFFTHADMGSDFNRVCPYVMTFDLPEKFDATEGFVAGLRDKKRELMAEHQNALTQIDRQISQLLAITCEVSA